MKSLYKYIIFAALLLIVSWCGMSLVRQWQAEKYSAKAGVLEKYVTSFSVHPVREISRSFSFYNKSVALNPVRSEFYYNLAKYYEDRAFEQGISEKARAGWFQKEKDELIKAIKLEPANAVYHLTLGWVCHQLFIYEEDLGYKKIAKKEFQLASELYPSKTKIQNYVRTYLSLLQ